MNEQRPNATEQACKKIREALNSGLISYGEIDEALVKGMFVTIHSWNTPNFDMPQNFKVDSQNNDEIQKQMIAYLNSIVSKGGCGEVLKVLAINKPFVIVHHCASKKNLRLDLREANIMMVSKDFVEASGFHYDYVEKSIESVV